MIKSFKHKGLKLFFETGSTRGIRSEHARKINGVLSVIHRARALDELLFLYQFHELKGDKKGFYAMTVSKNYRITFKFIDGNAYILDYEDYH
jgi:proteic killer suppression protein